MYAWRVEAALLRWDRPIGARLLFYPCLWGILAAGILTQASDGRIGRMLALHALGAWCMRSAGCIVNDIFDRHIDAQVARTRNRPLASGAMSVRSALLRLAVMCAGGAAVLTQLPGVAVIAACASLPLVVLYPLCKRVLKVPQAVLGIVFSWGVWTGYASVAGQIDPAAGWLYAAAVLFTLGYDTVYAAVDLEDAARLGVHSSVRTWGARTPLYVGCCYAGALTALGVYGVQAGLPSIFFPALVPAIVRCVADVRRFDPGAPDPELFRRADGTLAWVSAAFVLARVVAGAI